MIVLTQCLSETSAAKPITGDLMRFQLRTAGSKALKIGAGSAGAMPRCG